MPRKSPFTSVTAESPAMGNGPKMKATSTLPSSIMLMRLREVVSLASISISGWRRAYSFMASVIQSGQPDQSHQPTHRRLPLRSLEKEYFAAVRSCSRLENRRRNSSPACVRWMEEVSS